MTAEKLQEILRKHKLWLNGEPDGKKADLSGADLYRANLTGANLTMANLTEADLSGANLTRANLTEADLSGANLYRANLTGANLTMANLSGANLYRANLTGANLTGANLTRADLTGADLTGADLSGADLYRANLTGANLTMANLTEADLSGANLTGADLISSVNFMEAHFERAEAGYIAYKCFGGQYKPPKEWEIKPGAVISETVNPLRACDCGSGINVAPLDWVQKNYPRKEIWKVLIRWEWLAGVVCPYNSDGKIRCERVELVEVVQDGKV